MKKRYCITLFLLVAFIILTFSALFNYVVDPYRIYNTKFLNIPKVQQHGKIRLTKAIAISDIKPKSIILGTSRAGYGFDPNHEYFLKPAYNLSFGAATMYETRLYFEHVLKQKKLKKVLLVLDYEMFTYIKQKRIADFEKYFDDKLLKYKYLLSLKQIEDGWLTLKGKQTPSALYMENGQREKFHRLKYMKSQGSQYASMIKYESIFYKYYSTDYMYGDTKKSSFKDFTSILEQLYDNNIKTTIIFGPAHIRQWEALDYYLDYDLWLKWKVDVVETVNLISKKFNKKSFEIYDFSIYNKYTSEKIHKKKNVYMKYFWDSSHYKDNFGKLILEYLNNTFYEDNFAVKLDVKNVNEHINMLKSDREKYIDSKVYKLEIDKYLKKVVKSVNLKNQLKA